MPQPDFRGARGSNAGDDFHELWAIRQALALFDPDTELKGVSLEGLRAEDEHGVPAEVWDGIDCALYFNGNTVSAAARVDIIQLKYSAADPSKPWTLARLTSSSANTRNNSVLRRLATAFAGVHDQRGNSATGIHLQLISNQPVAPEVQALFWAIAANQKPNAARSDLRSVEKATNLKGEVLRQFAAALSFPETGSRFAVENRVLSTVASWTENDARTVLNNLLAYVARIMSPEGKGHWITAESLLAEFSFSSPAALYPCPPQILKVARLVPRSVSAQVSGEMLSGRKYMCLHGLAGCGKTTTLQELAGFLPSGSHLIVFDCYGAGRYLDSDAYRHRRKDAFLQLSNELASKLRVPLLLTQSDGVDYPRAFYRRVLQAAEALEAAALGALLVIVIDAADNSVAAAGRMVPPEASFVQDAITLGDLPENVRLLVTARTGRLGHLQLPDHFGLIQIGEFSRDETAQHVRSVWPDAPDPWIDDFAFHSHGNPRVQRYALQQSSANPADALAFLLPGGRSLTDVFHIQLAEAQKKAGRKEPLDGFTTALSVLPHSAPVAEIAAIGDLSEAEVLDICVDLAPGIRMTDRGVGFADEDFEDFIRNISAAHVAAARSRMADRFMQRHDSDQYAATHLAAALYGARRGKDVLSIIETQAQPEIVKDPILRRAIGFHRLQTAMQVSVESSDEASMLGTILVGAEAMHGADASLELIIKNPDLAAMLLGETAVRTLLMDSRQISHHGRLLFHLMLESARRGNAIVARSNQRQLAAWLQKRHEELKRKDDDRTRRRSEAWLVTADDIAAEFEAALRLAGPRRAIHILKRWRPRDIAVNAAHIVFKRLLAYGKTDLVQACLGDPAVKEPWSIFLLVPSALAGNRIDLQRLERALRRIHRRHWIDPEKIGGPHEDTFPTLWHETILTACEILVAHGHGHDTTRALLEVFADPKHRNIDRLYTSNTGLFALQLRATALLTHIEKRSLTIEEFLITPSDEGKEKAESSRDAKAQHREKLRSFIRPFIAFYNTRARILLGDVPATERAIVLGSMSPPASDDGHERAYETAEMREKAVAELALLRCAPDSDPSLILATCIRLMNLRPDYLGFGDLPVLSAFAPYPKLHDTILKTISGRTAKIVAERRAASEKVDGLLRLCRLVSDISRDEASALFAEAHRMSEEIDVDAVHQLRALSSLATRAVSALDQTERRTACQRLHSITTDAAIRLSNNEGFPWDTIVEATVNLDMPFALASVSRWQDSNVQDLDTTFPPLLRTGLQLRVIPTESAVALLPIVSHAPESLLKHIVNACIKSTAAAQIQAIDLLARDLLLRYSSYQEREIIKTLHEWSARHGQAPSPWLKALIETAAFVRQETPEQSSRRHFEVVVGREITFDPAERFTSTDEIIQAVQARVRTGRHHVAPSDVLAQMRDAVPVADRVAYLNGLAGMPSKAISSYVIAEAIFGAIEHPTWCDMAAIRQWCRVRLPDVIVERLPGFAHGLGYGGRPPLPPLLRRLAADGANVPSVLARAIGAHVNDLSASVVYELVRLIGEYAEPASAAVAFHKYSHRVHQRIPTTDIDMIDAAEVPNRPEVAIGRFLFALMSDCDIRLRWMAAHCVRRLARLGLTDWFDAWAVLYDNKQELAYRATGEPFYWLAARLWSVMVFDRVAVETPDALIAHATKIVRIAQDDSLPHVLIRGLAKDAALRLLGSGRIELDSKARKRLNASNTSLLLRPKTDKRRDKSSGEERDRSFDFDHLDTVRYWYEPAVDVFADVSLNEFLDVAERWIINEWKIPPRSSRWDLQSRKYRFSERNWVQSSNDHGKEPILERFSTYIERHAMFCAVGELMLTRALAMFDTNGGDRMNSWLTWRGMTDRPYWLADLRCPRPLERQFWIEPKDVTQWVKTTPDPAYLSEIGWSGEKTEAITVHSWHEIRSSSYGSRVAVGSALVEPATASSLVQAFQNSPDPYDYRLPDIQDQFEINAAPYRLLGWLQDFSMGSGVDSLDPFSATIGGITIKPGAAVASGLKESVRDQGDGAWAAPNGAVPFRYVAWSNKRRDNGSERRHYGLETEGHRLSSSTDVLKAYLRNTGMDLIVSVKISKEEGDGGYEKAGTQKAKSHTAKVVLLRKDGTVEDSSGRLGTW